jgi:hypothetical protein
VRRQQPRATGALSFLEGFCECTAAGFGHDGGEGGFCQLLERGLVAFAGPLVEFAGVRVCDAHAVGDVLVWPAQECAVDENLPHGGREPGQGGELGQGSEHFCPPNAKRAACGGPVGAFLPYKGSGRVACVRWSGAPFSASYCQFIRLPAGL